MEWIYILKAQPVNLIIPFIENKLSEVDWHKGPDHVHPENNRPEGARAVRLDWTLHGEAQDLPFEEIRRLMTAQVAPDIADLIVNGDTESTDPLLKVLDGEQKLGIRFDEIYISNPVVYSNVRESINVTEYEVFFNVMGVRGEE